MRVIIAEDEQHVLHGLRTMIGWNQLGFTEIDTAKNGLIAWEKFQSHVPDLIVSDVCMPKLSGLEFIRKVRNVNPTVPVIVLSGYGEFSYAQEAIHLGVTRYIMKPTVYTEIETEIRNVMEELLSIRKRHDRLAELQDQMERQLPVMREYFLHKMITSGLVIEETQRHILDFYQLDPHLFRNGIVISLKVHRAENIKMRLEKDWQLYKFACANVAEEIVSDVGIGYVLPFDHDRLPVLLCGNNPERLVSDAIKVTKETMNKIETFLNLNTNAGIGCVYPDVQQYPLSCKESVEMLALSELEGYNQMLYAGDTGDTFPDWPQYPHELAGTVSYWLQEHEMVPFETVWNDVERVLIRGKHVPFAYLQTVCSGIVTNVLIELLQAVPTLTEQIQPLATLQELQKQNTGQRLKEWMRNQLEHIYMLSIQHLSNGKSLSYVDYVKKQVAEHYNEEISFARLAKELNLSRNYLSNIFKRETGTSFVSYLTRFRINKAKEFLITNHYKVYEVAQMVGYPNAAYFSRMFKQVTDMSPLEYSLGAVHKQT
ncbi:response regulator [Paenibacillus piri]|nr:response regulator [Paenibacillus piri]